MIISEKQKNFKNIYAKLTQNVPFALLVFLSAIRAFAFDDKGNRVGVKAFGQLETWNMDILHTEGTLARFAVEMNMPVVMIASPFFFAEFVAEYASPIFEGMYYIMFQKEGKGTEDARLVHRNHLSFQIAQTLRVLFAHQGLHYEYAVGGWSDAFRFQPADHIL